MKEVKGFKGRIYVDGKGVIETTVSIKDGKIVAIGETNGEFEQLPENQLLVPGFIDKHIHGANHSDSMYPSEEDILNIAKTVSKEGVTSFLATTMTQSIENINKALKNLNEYIAKGVKDGAEVIGIHLEGPFINKVFKGAQPEEYILDCDVDQFKEFEEMSGNNIKQVTLAYEQNGKELTRYLVSKNIVASLGHTNATAKEVLEAAKLGATSLTHSYNAMKPLHHREAGTIGGALLADNMYLEVISDLIHVSPEAIEILYRIKGKEKLIVITDAMEAKHLPDGIFQLGGQDVFVKDNEARLESGALAGSVLHMNKGLKNIMNVLGVTLEETIDFATINPARNLYVDNKKGSIKVGKDADFAVIDENFNVYKTVRGGNVIFSK
ncbi:MAG: N-acetylglucosamine-6-phosphate deacetylase [Bacilli bacterium]|nr:N-acetylglucosamine-6-phosphate deacetylase [Bacilli bacterium]